MMAALAKKAEFEAQARALQEEMDGLGYVKKQVKLVCFVRRRMIVPTRAKVELRELQNSSQAAMDEVSAYPLTNESFQMITSIFYFLDQC